MAWRNRRGQHASRSHVRSPQGARPGSGHAEDVIGSGVPPARKLDRPARQGERGAPPVPPPRDQPEERLPTNFPVTIAKLIGRTTAVQRVRDLVSAYRVVTLTGAGGIGKTALAMKVGHRLLADFEHGAWLVELASLSDAALAPSAVAGALGLKLVGEQTTAESLARAIGDRHLLLVLDNCEHLIDAVATLVETVMQLCPRAIGSGDQPRGHADPGRGRLPRSGARRPRSGAGDTR